MIRDEGYEDDDVLGEGYPTDKFEDVLKMLFLDHVISREMLDDDYFYFRAESKKIKSFCILPVYVNDNENWLSAILVKAMYELNEVPAMDLKTISKLNSNHPGTKFYTDEDHLHLESYFQMIDVKKGYLIDVLMNWMCSLSILK